MDEQEKYYRDQMRKATEMVEVLGKIVMVVLAFVAGYLLARLISL